MDALLLFECRVDQWQRGHAKGVPLILSIEIQMDMKGVDQRTWNCYPTEGARARHVNLALILVLQGLAKCCERAQDHISK